MLLVMECVWHCKRLHNLLLRSDIGTVLRARKVATEVTLLNAFVSFHNARFIEWNPLRYTDQAPTQVNTQHTERASTVSHGRGRMKVLSISKASSIDRQPRLLCVGPKPVATRVRRSVFSCNTLSVMLPH